MREIIYLMHVNKEFNYNNRGKNENYFSVIANNKVIVFSES